MAAKLLKLAAIPTGLALTSFTLYAVRQREPEGSPLLRPSQLSIYSVPLQHSKYIEEEPGPLQLGLSAIRNTTHPYVEWCKNVFFSVQNGVRNTVQFGKDIFVYLKHPPPEFLPKVTVITMSGLTGLLLARKGSQFKKITYPLGFTTVGLSICYPAQTVIFTKVMGKKVYGASQWTYETIESFWTTDTSMNELESPQKIDDKLSSDQQENLATITNQDHDTSAPKSEVKSEMLITSAVLELPAEMTPIKPMPSPAEIGELDAEAKQAVTIDDTKERQFKHDPEIMDHGQAHPEDIDMYSTRS